VYNKRVTFERDEKLVKLEAFLLQKMASIIQPPESEVKNNIREVSLENAIKELINLEKQTK
jgi:hypothetical protein